MTSTSQFKEIAMKKKVTVIFIVLLTFVGALIVRADTWGGCEVTMAQDFNHVTVTFANTQADYSCHVDWGEGEPFDGPNSGASMYSYPHDYSYTPGGKKDFVLSINGEGRNITIDDTQPAGGSGNTASAPSVPKGTPWCAIEEGTFSATLTNVNHVHFQFKIMGEDKSFAVVEWMEGDSFNPSADFNGWVVADKDYPMDGDNVFHGVIKNRNTGDPCMPFTFIVSNGKTSLAYNGQVITSEGVTPVPQAPASVNEAQVAPVEVKVASDNACDIQPRAEYVELALHPKHCNWAAYVATDGTLWYTDQNGDWQVKSQVDRLPIQASEVEIGPMGEIYYTNEVGRFFTDRVGSWPRFLG